MHDGITRAREGKQSGRNSRHAGREQDTGLRTFIDCQAILDDFAVGMIEARVDESGSGSAWRLLAAGDEIEEIAPLFG
ncbi:hypothetical protein GGQ99_001636 [Aminobacter niigataensis]|uniref:Uncharacterized protein n=1 Tax=Aminobacter niigataensis TaxID=83265 RepID=A0ABR6KZE5_9HYPH|nr:hypothetical protein [Aminobacter niigataensis]